MNTKRKGSRNEYKSRDMMIALGYAVTKAGASLGDFDLIGLSATDVLLVQVKSNRWPSSVEMEAMEQAKCPPNARKIVHRWDDHARQPKVREI